MKIKAKEWRTPSPPGYPGQKTPSALSPKLSSEARGHLRTREDGHLPTPCPNHLVSHIGNKLALWDPSPEPRLMFFSVLQP